MQKSVEFKKRKSSQKHVLENMQYCYFRFTTFNDYFRNSKYDLGYG